MYLLLVVGFGILISWKFWQKMKVPIDTMLFAILRRVRDDDLKGYILPKKEDVPKRAVDILKEIEGKALKNIGVFGQGGSGKSTFLRWLAWQYSDAVESARIGLAEPIKVFVFNYHKFERGKGDFEGVDFQHIDISKNLPFLFKPEYREDLVRSFACVFVTEIRSKGLMASMLEDSFREILEYGVCRNWSDFKKNAEVVAKKSTGLTKEVAEIVAKKVRILDVGNVNEIDFNFDRSVILGFENLPVLAQNLYSEFYASLIYRKAEKESVAGRPHTIMLMVDECHRLLRYGDISIIAEILRNARKYMRTVIATQNFTDVLSTLRHFQHFQFGTHNSYDVRDISELSVLHAEGVRQLEEGEFVWVNDKTTEVIPIYKLDIERLEKFRNEHPQIYDEEARSRKDTDFVSDGKNVWKDGEEKKTEQKRKIVRAEIEPKIIEIVTTSNFGLYSSEILRQLGFSGQDRANVDKITKSLVVNKKIRMIHYVEAGLRPEQKPRKIYYLNLQNEETQIHLRGIENIKKICEVAGERILSEYKFNQGWDAEIEKCFIDFKTGLQNDVKDDLRKLRESSKPVIFVCVNYDIKKHYENALSYVEGIEGKYFVCCLNELVGLIRSLKNG